MIRDFNHFSFTVADLDRSVNFYVEGLGFGLADRSGRDPEFSERVTGVKGAELDVAYLKTPACTIELIQYLSPRGEKADTRTQNVGSAHICFNVENFGDSLEKAVAAGAEISGEVCTIPAGPNKGNHVVYFEDPDGNTLEFISTGAEAGVEKRFERK